MRSIATLLFCLLALSRAAYAADDVSQKLIGTWRLISFKVQVVGEGTDTPRDMLGPQPFGRIIMTPEHTMAAYIAKEDRKGPPTNDAEAAALLSSMNAYTGRYRIERAINSSRQWMARGTRSSRRASKFAISP